jgi:colicin import membrane protein
MPGFVREHLRPLAGAAVFHVALLLLLGAAALRWTTSQPPVQLAIEGVVVDERDMPAAKGTPRVDAPEPRPAETPPPPVERPPEPGPDREAEQKAAAEQQAQREREEAVKLEREAEAAREQEARRAAEVREREQAEAAARKAEKEAQERAAAEAKRKEAEQHEAKQQAARETELQRNLAAEEEASEVARSGVVDDYRRMLIETIERNWNRPPTARAGLECTLNVTQAPGGTVIDVKVGDCNGDAAVRESITNAVFRSSPLPPPRDPRAFERRLVIVFKPTE